MPDKVELSIQQLADLYVKALAEADQSPIADGWTVQEIVKDFYAWLHDDVEDTVESLPPLGKDCTFVKVDPHTSLADKLFKGQIADIKLRFGKCSKEDSDSANS